MELGVPEPCLPPAALPQLESPPLLSPAHRWRRDLVAPEAESQAKRTGIVSGLTAGPSCRCWADSSTSLLPGEAAGAAPKLLWFPERRSPGSLPWPGHQLASAAVGTARWLRVCFRGDPAASILQALEQDGGSGTVQGPRCSLQVPEYGMGPHVSCEGLGQLSSFPKR